MADEDNNADEIANTGKPIERLSSEKVAEFKPFGETGDDPITRNLKKAFAEIAAEPIPDELLALLSRLDDADDKDAR